MNLRRLLLNRTLMEARTVVLDDRHGREQFVTIAKMTWAVAPDGVVTLAVPRAPIRLGAALHAGPGSSVRYPGELFQHKPGTDVVLVGTARPSETTRQTEMLVRLRVAEQDRMHIDKTVRVLGARVWQKAMRGVTPGPPAPLTPTPLIYENAYGGRDAGDPRAPLQEPRNPIGTGVAREPSELVGQPTPCQEDPERPLSGPMPNPASFGPIPANWEPLAGRRGTRDDRWRRERAPVVPLDFDERAYACAPDDQRCDPPLRGDDMFEIHGVLADRIWRFRLPLYRPTFWSRRRDEPEERELDTHLDTVLIDADEGLVELTWRASVPVPRVPQMMEWVRVISSDPLPDNVNEQVLALAREDGPGVRRPPEEGREL